MCYTLLTCTIFCYANFFIITLDVLQDVLSVEKCNLYGKTLVLLHNVCLVCYVLVSNFSRYVQYFSCVLYIVRSFSTVKY